jgi:hypothetical protein
VPAKVETTTLVRRSKVVRDRDGGDAGGHGVDEVGDDHAVVAGLGDLNVGEEERRAIGFEAGDGGVLVEPAVAERGGAGGDDREGDRVTEVDRLAFGLGDEEGGFAALVLDHVAADGGGGADLATEAPLFAVRVDGVEEDRVAFDLGRFVGVTGAPLCELEGFRGDPIPGGIGECGGGGSEGSDPVAVEEVGGAVAELRVIREESVFVGAADGHEVAGSAAVGHAFGEGAGEGPGDQRGIDALVPVAGDGAGDGSGVGGGGEGGAAGAAGDGESLESDQVRGGQEAAAGDDDDGGGLAPVAAALFGILVAGAVTAEPGDQLDCGGLAGADAGEFDGPAAEDVAAGGDGVFGEGDRGTGGLEFRTGRSREDLGHEPAVGGGGFRAGDHRARVENAGDSGDEVHGSRTGAGDVEDGDPAGDRTVAVGYDGLVTARIRSLGAGEHELVAGGVGERQAIPGPRVGRRFGAHRLDQQGGRAAGGHDEIAGLADDTGRARLPGRGFELDDEAERASGGVGRVVPLFAVLVEGVVEHGGVLAGGDVVGFLGGPVTVVERFAGDPLPAVGGFGGVGGLVGADPEPVEPVGRAAAEFGVFGEEAVFVGTGDGGEVSGEAAEGKPGGAGAGLGPGGAGGFDAGIPMAVGGGEDGRHRLRDHERGDGAGGGAIAVGDDGPVPAFRGGPDVGEDEGESGGAGDGFAVPVPGGGERWVALDGEAEVGDAADGDRLAGGLGHDDDDLGRIEGEAADLMVLAVGHEQGSAGIDRQAGGMEELRFGGGAVLAPGAAPAGHGLDQAFRGEAADGVVAVVGKVHVAMRVHRDSVGFAEAGLGGGTVAIAGDPVAGERGHHAGGVDLADALSPVLGDVDVAVGIEREAARPVQSGLGPGSVGVAGLAVADPGGDGAVGGDAADGVVGEVGDEEVPGGVDDEVVGVVEQGGLSRAVAVAGHARTRDRGDRSVGGDPADAVVLGIGHVDVPVGVHADPEGEVESSRGRETVEESPDTAAGVGGDGAVGGDLADAVVLDVGDVEVAGAVDGAAIGGAEAGGAGGAVDESGGSGAGMGADDDQVGEELGGEGDGERGDLAGDGSENVAADHGVAAGGGGGDGGEDEGGGLGASGEDVGALALPLVGDGLGSRGGGG